jgi:hypothetical protein
MMLFAFVSSVAFSQCGGDVTIRNGGKCEYFVKHLNKWPSADGKQTYDPSPVDTSALRAALGAGAHESKPGPNVMERAHRKDAAPPFVIESFHFKDAPGFTLLRYEYFYWNDRVWAYVAYFEHTGEWYLLYDGRGLDSGALIKNYNNMLASHSEELSWLCVECKAAMLVSILYADLYPLFIVSDCEDIAIVESLDSSSNYCCGLFVLSMVGDTLVVPRKGLHEWAIDGVGLDSLGLLKRIQVCDKADTTTVCFSTYWVDDVTPWCVVFSGNGNLLRIGCTQKPVCSYDVNHPLDANIFDVIGITNVGCEEEER